MTQRVLITGGSGFIGSNLVRRLTAAGSSVRVVDSFVTGDRSYLDGLGVDLREGDILDPGVLEAALEDIDAVVHLAAGGNVVDSVADPAPNFRSNVVGTFTVLDAVRRSGTGKVVFASTGGALIGNAEPPVDETSLPKPISPYGASKLAGEAYCSAFAEAYGLSVVALRFANVYGPWSGHKKGAITRFFRALHDGTPIEIFGDGSASRDFLYVDDICAGIEAGLATARTGPTVAHLASGVETTVGELAAACCRVAGKPDHPVTFRPSRPGEVERNFASFARAREVLGFEPRVDLESGLAATWAWLREHSFQ